MTTLMAASNQWSTRPADQRFPSLEALHAACERWRAESIERSYPYSDLTPVVTEDGVGLRGPTNGIAKLTHWAFGQLAARAQAPAAYLRTLPAALAVTNLLHGLSRRPQADTAALMFRKNGDLAVRSILTPDYTRIWDVDVTRRLLELQQAGPWQPAPAAFDGSRGLYASDHDMFAFLVDSDRRIFEKGPGGGLSRGFFAANSEVGDKSFWLMKFWYEYCCGNHRVVGATNITEVRIPHRGRAESKAWASLQATLVRYAEASAAEDELRIQRAHTVTLGNTKDEVLDAVFALRVPVLSRKRIEEAYDRAAQAESVEKYGDPRTVWGFTGGLTEVARDLPYADERTALDRASGKVMELAF